MLRTRQVRARGESRRRKRMRGGRGAAVASSIKEVVAVAVHTPLLMTLQQVAARLGLVLRCVCLRRVFVGLLSASLWQAATDTGHRVKV